MASMTSAAFFCIPEETMDQTQRIIYSSVSIFSSLLAIGGATAQIYQWRPLLRNYLLRRGPTPNPMIVTSLAWANLMVCLGVISRAVLILTTSPPSQSIIVPFSNESHFIDIDNTFPHIPLNGNKALLGVSMTIEVLNQYLFGVAFMWTVLYAVDIYYQLMYKEIPDLLFRILAWTLPLLPCTAVLLSVFLGTFNIFDRCPTGTRLLLRHLAYYSSMIVALVADPVVYCLCRLQINKRIRESGLLNSHNRSIMTALNRKFLAVIIIFFACWISNFIDSVIEIIAVLAACSPASMKQFYPIWVIQALMNPIQGFFNFFIYGRHMLFTRVANGEVGITASDEKDAEQTPILYNWNAYSRMTEDSTAKSAL